MSMPHEYADSPLDIAPNEAVMGMAEPLPAARPNPPESAGDGTRHVNRSTLILPEQEVGEWSPAMRYLAEHDEISHVLLSGSDSLDLPGVRLREVLERLAAVEHVRMIRLYSGLPARQPERIAENRELLGVLSEYSASDRSLYVMMRFRRPEEVGEKALEAFRALSEAGASLVAEVPIVAGTNDDPDALAELFDRLTRASVIPYQFIIDRPASGGEEGAELPLERVYRLAEAVKSRISGPARRARLTMMHSAGYFEILAVENGKAYVKGHLSASDDNGRFMIVDCPPDAARFDDRSVPKPAERSGKFPSDATYLKVPYEIPD